MYSWPHRNHKCYSVTDIQYLKKTSVSNLQYTVRSRDKPGKTSKPFPVPSHAVPNFVPSGTLFKIHAPLVTVVPPICLLADTSNNPDIWPVSNSLQHLIALILPLEASFLEICDLALFSHRALFCSLVLVPFLFFLASCISHSQSCGLHGGPISSVKLLLWSLT